MKLKYTPIILITALTLGLASCGGDEDEGKSDGMDASDTGKTVGRDVNQPMEATIGEYRFSVPSPIQMSKMIKESGAPFNADLVNSHENASHYATNFQKALNLGVYGADLGYLTIYGVTDDALSYITAVRKMTDELGIAGAFDDELLTRLSDNIGVEDSMEVLVAEAYSAGNEYLQINQDYDVIGLMLTGGMIESLYFACDVAKTSQDQDVLNRIGNQKSSLKNLINLLTDVNKDKGDDLIADLIKKLIKLENKFNNINISYEFREPKHVPEKKTTYFTSTSNVDISDEDLTEIISIVSEIRSDIID